MQKEQWNGKRLKEVIADSLNLPNDLRNLMYEKYPDDEIIINRLSWALSKGASAGIFFRPRCGMYQMTELGKKLFKKYGYNLNGEIIQVQSQYLAHEDEMKKGKEEPKLSTGPAFADLDTDSEEEVPGTSELTLFIKKIDKQVERYNAEIADDLLD